MAFFIYPLQHIAFAEVLLFFKLTEVLPNFRRQLIVEYIGHYHHTCDHKLLMRSRSSQIKSEKKLNRLPGYNYKIAAMQARAESGY